MTYIFDLDGTLMPHHKTEWLPRARIMLDCILREGNAVVFVTARGPQDEGTAWSVSKTMAFMKREQMTHIPILYDMPAGRVIVDDRKPHAVWRNKDEDWVSGTPDLPENFGENKKQK
jgi:hypothetical protein